MDLGRGVNDFVVADQPHEIHAGRAPGLQQAVLAARQQADGLGRFAFRQRAYPLQVAPVVLRRRRHETVQGADPGLGGNHPQHVGRDVEGGERGQPRRQALRQRAAGALEAVQVLLDPARAVLLVARDPAPQDRLRVIRIRAGLPAQQPVAAPGLVLAEHLRQLPGQRPGAQRIIALHVGGNGGQRGLGQQFSVGERGVQRPVQGFRIELFALLVQVRLQRMANELAGREELDIGGDPVARGQGGLQPAAHGHLRDQHDVRRQRRGPRRRRAQDLRQHLRQHLQGVGVVEAEVGRGGHGHGPHHCAGARSQQPRPAMIGWRPTAHGR